MRTEEKRIVICTARPANVCGFIEFWEPIYFNDDQKQYDLEKLYTKNIKGLHTTDTLTDLFKWKMGVHFHAPNLHRSVNENFISKIEEARKLSGKVSPEDFLQKFPNGGVIYRIFWLHCWYPNRFPIYDENVHRAMVFIRDGRVDELSKHSDRRKIEQYLQYVDFFERFRAESEKLFEEKSDGVPGRKADRALLTFGQKLQSRIFREMIAAAGRS